MKKEALSAVALKGALWETLHGLREGTTQPEVADAMARQAREILHASRVQLRILAMSNQPVSTELIEFARPTK